MTRTSGLTAGGGGARIPGMAQSFEIEGTVKVIMDLQTWDSGFSKREFVLEVEDGNYPQMVKFECVRDKTALLDDASEGDRVKVRFDIRGNEYKGRYYVNLNAWKIEKAEGGASVEEAPSETGDDYFDSEPDPSDLSDEPPF